MIGILKNLNFIDKEIFAAQRQMFMAPRERKAEYKPLSFSTTMRNPARIADFLQCILPYQGQILTNRIILAVAAALIKKKLYQPLYINRTPRLKAVLNEERDFSDEEAAEIMQNSPQNHKEAGFDKGWPSRFDTWYKLSMEFGFIYYEMDSPIEISPTGHMLIDAHNENPVNDEKIKNVFLNALMKYQTNNPFRKNANDNSPLVLLLQVIKLLKEDPDENDAGIFRSELSLIICWPNRDAYALYQKIKELRGAFRFTYGDEIIYEICLDLLGATERQRNRFKLNQITGEAVDEFIRKMRITGVVSLRGNGRFIDFNSFESDKIEYILKHYSICETHNTKAAFFKYIGTIDPNILSLTQPVDENAASDVRIATLKRWAEEYSKDDIVNELNIVCSHGESKNPVLKIIDKPTRLEFLTSIALTQHFPGLRVQPHYHVDDEGLPTFTASGGTADIECCDEDCILLVEVTLMCARNQATNEMPAITRHLQEAMEQQPERTLFSLLLAPSIHADSKYMAAFSKHQYKVDILTLTINEFIAQISTKERIKEMLSV